MPNPRHDPNAYKVGDRVGIMEKFQQAPGWSDSWNPRMDKYLGKSGIVIRADSTQGVQVRTEDGQQFWYPSCSLVGEARPKANLIVPRTGVIVANGDMGTAPPAAPRKKRVRVGAGPWDNAPCAHLRWHLMGIFREKLSLVKTSVVVAGEPLGYVAEVEVTCPKCQKTMTLQAK